MTDAEALDRLRRARYALAELDATLIEWWPDLELLTPAELRTVAELEEERLAALRAIRSAELAAVR